MSEFSPTGREAELNHEAEQLSTNLANGELANDTPVLTAIDNERAGKSKNNEEPSQGPSIENPDGTAQK